RVDTSGGWEVSLTYLQDSLRFILASSKTSANQEVGIRNIGSLSLQVLSVRTGNDDGDWLDYQILANSLSVVQDNTDVSRITTPITVAAGEELPVRLSFDVSSMSGDQTVHDTLYLTTSDFLTPSLKVPFTVRWDDLPSVQVFSQLQDDTSRVALTPYFAVNSSLVFAFSEPVRTASLPSYLKIYSRLDSIARGVNGITTLESAYSTVYSLRLAKRTGVTLTGMADTAIFTPYYTTVSDSIGAKPPPGYFLRGDQLGIWFSNSIVDSAGNPLDLQGKHVLTTAGTLDTTLVVATDTSTLRVLETWPKEGELYDPDEDIRILFSKPLSTTMVLDGDTTLALDLSTLDGDSNTTVQMRSRYGNNLLSDFRYLKLDRGDSLLVLRPKYKFLSSDSVQVWLSPSIASSQGHTLDGDSNGITSWPVVDTVDSYSFRFVVGATDFYAFPNPFKFSNAEHREKGCISFKNLHQIKGVNLEKEIEIRIYSVDGNLVYSTKRKKNSFLYSAEGAQAPQFDWYLRNNHDRPVASGTYLYTISQSGKVLKKSKLMIIR
ncbi:MAG TPA: hypothetical protein VLM37_12155, partial [Fibrobacteraceae bacterium]|nr:hypothetical protein [Fibrobacteraceae bacterium]